MNTAVLILTLVLAYVQAEFSCTCYQAKSGEYRVEYKWDSLDQVSFVGMYHTITPTLDACRSRSLSGVTIVDNLESGKGTDFNPLVQGLEDYHCVLFHGKVSGGHEEFSCTERMTYINTSCPEATYPMFTPTPTPDVPLPQYEEITSPLHYLLLATLLPFFLVCAGLVYFIKRYRTTNVNESELSTYDVVVPGDNNLQEESDDDEHVELQSEDQGPHISPAPLQPLYLPTQVNQS
eukprot:TRINITY_DN5125_c0_g1_i1.p1 TRINITY_DN5125_c0_g1~~TRINITY_DN5125_c0_g1_i1.p1  ORF type:complete len:235 (+),score=40.92 TRINITY_DN5125_c0_g1_i1:38-742(+)